MRIMRLAPLLANQIAAGEVIERPVSVVKELLENSIDAGATKITVQLDKAGIERIEVRDDGCGIAQEDLPLAVLRHATSKISTLDDLAEIASLGFRGEALASIAAVSRLTLTSRQTDTAQAFCLHCDPAADAPEITPAAHPVGTTVSVNQLFFNTPVRRRFLRTEKTELEHILELVRKVALAEMSISITVIHNEREVLRLPGASSPAQRVQRVAKVCGKNFVDNAHEIQVNVGDLSLTGWLGDAASARSQADTQYFFLNHRIVRDKLINHAVRQAYEPYLYTGKFPAYVLYLDLPPMSVDVNVHPTKHEVRFHEARLVHDFLVRAIGEGLMPEIALTIPSASAEPVRPIHIPREHSDTQVVRVAATAAPTSELRPPLFPPASLPTVTEIREQQAAYQQLRDSLPKVQKPTANYRGTVQNKFGKVIAVLDRRVIIAELPAALLAIDLQQLYPALAAVHWQARLDNGLAITGVPLLLPQEITLTQSVAEALPALLERLAPWGITLKCHGDTACTVRAMPEWLHDVDYVALLTQLTQAGSDVARFRVLSGFTRYFIPPQLHIAQADALLRECEQYDLDLAFARNWSLTTLIEAVVPAKAC